MRIPRALVTAAVATGAFFAGRWQGVPEPGPATAQTVRAVEPPAPKRPRVGLVCARTTGAGDDDSTDCDALEIESRWCRSELAQCRRERQAVRQEWPSDATIEDPGAWSDAVEEAFAQCEIPGEIELIDCTEYPCTAALRPPTAPKDPKAFEGQMEAAMRAVQACAPLREAFGVAGSDVTGDVLGSALDVYRMDAECGDAREKFLVLAALDPAGPAFDLLTKEHKTDEEDRDLNRWMYRRADDLAALWPCEGGR